MSNYTSTYSERWENLTLANNFMFCKIMESEPELCRQLLELLLHIKIDHLEKPVAERTLQESISSKSVRFDVYTKDDNRIFDVEIQTVNKSNLPKRARYYQSIIDVSNLNTGMDYDELNDTYIIFICLNDLFGKGHTKSFLMLQPVIKLNRRKKGRFLIFLQEKALTLTLQNGFLKNYFLPGKILSGGISL